LSCSCSFSLKLMQFDIVIEPKMSFGTGHLRQLIWWFNIWNGCYWNENTWYGMRNCHFSNTCRDERSTIIDAIDIDNGVIWIQWKCTTQ
jgi:hypothetical protein